MHPDSKPSVESTPSTEPTLLKRREIEARIAVPLIQAFAEKIGREQALAVAAAVIQSVARAAGEQMAEKIGANDLAALAWVVREVWSADQALDAEFLEETERQLRFNVRRCAYVELYEKLGVKEFGVCLSCCRDASFTEGFNHRIKLQRTQTIMEGAPRCDFRFTKK
jgi:uncharacterized sporulation protein YeaH/YhbH (DUF444 family)